MRDHEQALRRVGAELEQVRSGGADSVKLSCMPVAVASIAAAAAGAASASAT